MQMPSYILLYVTDPIASAAFYEGILGTKPVELAPTFALFVFGNGLKLGLWRREGVEPAAEGAPGSAEICVALPDRSAVDALHAVWAETGVTIAQGPTPMDFGYTFTALDPDKHRIRAFVPE
ncbi:MAG: VOC family protein [Ancalomicrobiaceae bacterium]|nr:VOC family protein [Ancalomicrobiaceae bacterium]